MLNSLKIRLLEKSKAKITLLLLAINITIYFSLPEDKPDILHLLVNGANFAPYTLSTQPYRLVSAMFLHGGLLHLLLNMYNLLVIGAILEKKIGSVHFLNIYFLTGVSASMASCLNLFTVSVGASGAIFGLYGFLFLKGWQDEKRERTSLTITFLIFLFVNYIFGTNFNIDHYAHIGGVLSGTLLFILFNFNNSPITLLSVWVLPIAGYFYVPTTQVQYYQAYQYMMQKDEHIRSALNSYYLDQKEQAEKINIVKNLPDSIKLKFAQIQNLPAELQWDTAAINEFFQMRSQQISYFLKLLENDSYLYQDSILFVRDLMTNSIRPNYQLTFENYSTDNSNIRIDQNGLKQKREYYDESWDVTPYVYKAKFYRIGTKDSLGNWHGKIVDYFSNDTPQMKGTYNSGLKHGIFIYYNEDGTYSSSGQYQNDKQVGKWEHYYSNNRLKSEIRYVDSFSFVENILDTLGNYMVKDGQGEEIRYFNNGTIRFRRTIVGGLNHGMKEGYYEDGGLYFQEHHIEGYMEYGISYDSLGNIYRYEDETEWPYPEGGYDNLVQYFEQNNQLMTSDFDNYVHLKFDVEKDGSISDIKFIKRINPELDNYAQSLLLNGPKWYPARFRGFNKVVREAHVYIRF